MEIFNSSRFSVGKNLNIRLNNMKNQVHFMQTEPRDVFQSTSYANLCDEKEINKLILQNPEISRILKENNISKKLNMFELKQLFDYHCKDTQNVAVAIANSLPPMLKHQINIKDLKDAALLHDFGKVLIPLEILNKQGPLNPSEQKIMDMHSELGYQLLKSTGINENVLKLVRYHHNNVYGKNYIPDINLQVLNLADKYSALTEERVYKTKYTPQKALTILFGEVKRGSIHPFLFNSLVKVVLPQSDSNIVKKY